MSARIRNTQNKFFNCRALIKQKNDDEATALARVSDRGARQKKYGCVGFDWSAPGGTICIWRGYDHVDLGSLVHDRDAIHKTRNQGG